MQSWGLTDVGCTRAQNQDAFLMEQLDKHTLLCVVCDGMGGAKSGNVASTLAAEVFVEEVRQTWIPNMKADDAEQMLRSAVKLANFTVYDQAQQLEGFSGMGTTLVALLIQGKEAIIVNIGDSRAYRVGKNGIRRLTTDHSLVQMMAERGDLTPEQARNYPGKKIAHDMAQVPHGHTKEEKKGIGIGIAASVLFHVMLLFVFVNAGLKYI